MNSVTQENGYTVAWAAPEIPEGTYAITREVDMLAFGMVVIEVGPCALPHLVLEVEGWMVCLTSQSHLRFLQESICSVNSQPQLLLQKLGVANTQLVHRWCKNKG